jgi:PBP1b-binding outer membrane lipoprotein LpoB
MRNRVWVLLTIWGLVAIGALFLLGGCRQSTTPPASETSTAAPSEPATTPSQTSSQEAETPATQPVASSPALPSVETASSEPAAASSSGTLVDGQVLLWEREGGSAGFCDRIVVYADGQVVATSCEAQLSVERGSITLTAQQENQLNEWLRTLKAFDKTKSDNALTNPTTIRVVFAGTGDMDATDTDAGALASFAADLYVLATDQSVQVPEEPLPGPIQSSGQATSPTSP